MGRPKGNFGTSSTRAKSFSKGGKINRKPVKRKCCK